MLATLPSEARATASMRAGDLLDSEGRRARHNSISTTCSDASQLAVAAPEPPTTTRLRLARQCRFGCFAPGVMYLTSCGPGMIVRPYRVWAREVRYVGRGPETTCCARAVAESLESSKSERACAAKSSNAERARLAHGAAHTALLTCPLVVCY